MARINKTFSESWYRIAAHHVWLRPHVQVHRQFFRGRKWFVLRDPFTNTAERATHLLFRNPKLKE